VSEEVHQQWEFEA